MTSGETKEKTPASLRELQTLLFRLISQPLGDEGKIDLCAVENTLPCPISDIVLPNSRLTSSQRIEIYNQQYWWRLLDCLDEDFPGLKHILGDERFDKLKLAYLKENPSRSYLLRDLGKDLASFVEMNPRLVAPVERLAVDMARFEWAQVLAFDESPRAPLGVVELAGKNAEKLRVALQPYVVLLELGFPLDDFSIALKREQRSIVREAAALRGGAENGSGISAEISDIGRERIWLAVHRYKNRIYFKRLEQQAFRLLCMIRDGETVGGACEELLSEFEELPHSDLEKLPAKISEWFASFARLGWFCSFQSEKDESS